MSITSEFESSVHHLKRYLRENPRQAPKVAIAHYQKWKKLEIENQKLVKRCQELDAYNIKLKSPQSHHNVSLPGFLNSERGMS